MISVVKEGIICGKIGVNYMHDITEGGVFGAVWEASKAINKGIKIKEDLIPVKDVTRKLGALLDIDIYRLISSGSMLIIADEKKAGEITVELYKNGINSTVIGEIIESNVILEKDGNMVEIEPPTSDELYKVLDF